MVDAGTPGLFYDKQKTYGYSCTRVRAQKALMLDRQFFEDMANQRTLDAMTAMLERTYYKKTLTTLSTVHAGTELLEMAAEVHYKDTVNNVRKFTPEDGKPVVNMLLRKWDIINLRMIISSRRTGKTWEQIRPYLVSAGELYVHEMEKIAKCEPEKLYMKIKETSVGRQILSKSSRNMRGTELEQMFIKAVKNFQVLNQLQAILDTSYYDYLESSIKSSDPDVIWIKKTVSKEIDLRNLMSILRIKASGMKDPAKIEQYLVRGGRVGKEQVDALLKANSPKETLATVKQFFKIKTDDYSSLASLEVALQQELARERVRVFYKNSVSIATLAGFLFIKEEEMNNIRKIARGRDYHLTPEEIKAMLVHY